MLRNFPAPIIGAINTLLLVTNLLFWSLPVYALIAVKLCTRGRARRRVSHWIALLAQNWGAVNTWIWDRTVAIEWDLRGDIQLRRDGQYLVLCNHQSWNDIPVLMKVFGREAPFFRFFIKQELIWVPILGPVWWGLDFPFMKRHTPKQIARNPKLRGRDLATTRLACEKYRDLSVIVLNFAEGTRFTPVKRDAQNSPYIHLLKPRAGGVAFVLAALGDKLDAVLDVTIAYPDGARGLWALMAGQVRRVVVDVHAPELPRALIQADDGASVGTRADARAWIEALWAEKDARIATLLAESDQPDKQTP